jgi:hypothetical protein
MTDFNIKYNSRKEYLNLYSCILRKFYIGEEDYMFTTLKYLTKTEIIESWNYALKKIQHVERIKNADEIAQISKTEILKRIQLLNDLDKKIQYLFSDFKPSEFKLKEENIERRMRFLIAVKTLNSIEEKINSQIIEVEVNKKLEIEKNKINDKFQDELKKVKDYFIDLSERNKTRNRRFMFGVILISSISGYFIISQNKDLEKQNFSLKKDLKIESKKLNHNIDSLKILTSDLKQENSRINSLLTNQEYLNQALNENKLQNLKFNGYSGKISFDGIYGYKSIKGELIDGAERGVWIYENYSGKKEIYKWISVRVGAKCRDGSSSNATGRGACSHHGGVDYWQIQYERIKVH